MGVDRPKRRCERINTWMSQEFSKWLVNELQPTYRYILGL